MATKYDNAVTALYGAPFDQFVSERKRLTAELKTSGDNAGASRLASATRPPVSAWAVNQLYWRDKKTFGDLFRTAQRLRDAALDPAATDAHREVIAKLRGGAAKILAAAGKSANEAMLRRVTSTLTALAAIGSFEPDPPGALKGDRDPPGFDVVGLLDSLPAKEKADTKSLKPNPAEAKRREKAEAVAERRRVEREEKQEKAERERLERKLRIAQGVLEARKEEVSRLKEKLAEAEALRKDARAVVRELEKELR